MVPERQRHEAISYGHSSQMAGQVVRCGVSGWHWPGSPPHALQSRCTPLCGDSPRQWRGVGCCSQVFEALGMTRYRVSLELDHGFSVEGEVRRLLRARREAEVSE